MNDNSSFEKMSSAFNTSFSASNEDEIESDIAIIEKKKNELLDRIKPKDGGVFRDSEWLDFELKTLICESRNILHKLDSDIKIGSSPRHFEVYAKLLDSVLQQYKELRDMNKMIWDMQREPEISNGKQTTNENKISFTANQLSDFVKKLKDNNSMNNIDADFKILEKDSKEK
jgi:hypothetical protein